MWVILHQKVYIDKSPRAGDYNFLYMGYYINIHISIDKCADMVLGDAYHRWAVSISALLCLRYAVQGGRLIIAPTKDRSIAVEVDPNNEKDGR